MDSLPLDVLIKIVEKTKSSDHKNIHKVCKDLRAAINCVAVTLHPRDKLTGPQLVELCARFPRAVSLDLSRNNVWGKQSLQSFNILVAALGPAFQNLASLESLALANRTAMSLLPRTICSLTSLRDLDLHDCSRLKTLPEELGNLTSLTSIGLLRCSSLRTLPNAIGNLSSLKILDLSWCGALRVLPEAMGQLGKLQELYLGNTEVLLSSSKSLEDLTSLKCLDLYSLDMYSNDNSLPDDLFRRMSALQTLNLGRVCYLEALPSSISCLVSLKRLDLRRCTFLEVLPECMSALTALWVLYMSHFHARINFPLKGTPIQIIGKCQRQYNQRTMSFHFCVDDIHDTLS